MKFLNITTSHVGQVTAAVCAHLVDAASFIHERREKSKEDSSSSIIPAFVMASVTTSSSSRDSSPLYQDIYKKFLHTVFSITDVDGDSSMRQLQCWSGAGELPQCVITFEIGETIKVVDVMQGSELEGDWSQMSSQVT
ncbi:hypothetical protein HOLleu_25915 [Holothuria leucospilota]|uniref:Uncharacterized protein n=1 Tax=Holothuria leucospilota TaxID=206669 RepID=A0A9Q1H4B7_HOLLE|nr:hypothetical protein HOLleu_25915 [Holothuria leucospilota]